MLSDTAMHKSGDSMCRGKIDLIFLGFQKQKPGVSIAVSISV